MIVARGFVQQIGKNFHETYTPVARLSAIRLAMAFAAQKDVLIQQNDVVTALKEEVYMETVKMKRKVL